MVHLDAASTDFQLEPQHLRFPLDLKRKKYPEYLFLYLLTRKKTNIPLQSTPTSQ